MPVPELQQRLADWFQSLTTFAGVARTIVVLCAFTTLTAVLLNFLLAQRVTAVKRERRSVVATASMLGFFGGFFCLLRFGIGAVGNLPLAVTRPAAVLGLTLIVAGTIMNLLGRIALGTNWGDHIRIYRNHGLVTGGVYRRLRHPLYASLLWMFSGAALLFLNPLALAANLGVFLPAMLYRARQEENALAAEFPPYAEYRRRTGMFLPRLPFSWNRK
jgi:protein-S-isoprenylcysteine O-methyltransferase Ste14